MSVDSTPREPVDVMIHAMGGTIVEEQVLHVHKGKSRLILMPSVHAVNAIMAMLREKFPDLSFGQTYPLGEQMIDSAKATATTIKRMANFVRRSMEANEALRLHVVVGGTDTYSERDMGMIQAISEKAMEGITLILVDSMRSFEARPTYVMGLIQAAVKLGLEELMRGRAAHVMHGSAYQLRGSEKIDKSAYDSVSSRYRKTATYSKKKRGWTILRKTKHPAETFQGTYGEAYQLKAGVGFEVLNAMTDYHQLYMRIAKSKAPGYVLAAPGKGNVRTTQRALAALSKMAHTEKPIVVVGRGLSDATRKSRQDKYLYGRETPSLPIAVKDLEIFFETAEDACDIEELKRQLSQAPVEDHRYDLSLDDAQYEGDPEFVKRIINGMDMSPTEALMMLSQFLAEPGSGPRGKPSLSDIQQRFKDYPFRETKK